MRDMVAMGMVSTIAAFVAGWMGGAAGIGGVLLVPALATIERIPAHTSIAAASVAFTVMGALALLRFRAEGRPLVGDPGLLLAAAPGAALGGLLVHEVQAKHLLAAVGLMLIASGLQGAVRPAAAPLPEPPPRALAFVGFFVGLGSAMTGTGGAVLLIPILLALRQPLQPTIAMSIAIQLPIGGFATAAHALAGAIEPVLATQLSLSLVGGAVAGRWCADRVPVRLIRRFVTVLLLTVGLWILWRPPL
ncbi:MAG: sulfite exporter TauE/SafE family protein [Burkholderiaceae bacterium]|nr:sulfite exporter TauE/SafE family protein [Burkholderiaceae bacterium]